MRSIGIVLASLLAAGWTSPASAQTAPATAEQIKPQATDNDESPHTENQRGSHDQSRQADDSKTPQSTNSTEESVEATKNVLGVDAAAGAGVAPGSDG